MKTILKSNSEHVPADGIVHIPKTTARSDVLLTGEVTEKMYKGAP